MELRGGRKRVARGGCGTGGGGGSADSQPVEQTSALHISLPVSIKPIHGAAFSHIASSCPRHISPWSFLSACSPQFSFSLPFSLSLDILFSTLPRQFCVLVSTSAPREIQAGPVKMRKSYLVS